MNSVFSIEGQQNPLRKGRGRYGLGLEQPISGRLIVTCLCCYPINDEDSPLTHTATLAPFVVRCETFLRHFFVHSDSPYICTESPERQKKRRSLFTMASFVLKVLNVRFLIRRGTCLHRPSTETLFAVCRRYIYNFKLCILKLSEFERGCNKLIVL